ncbi:hypothetical protein Nepgr_030435 [Nepenthes gracilis]|uniref:RING-CH-type domain-containing protein n=1 Tax=Nepenthes gracilis TaxID=150966 RepID=A0AAD3TGZ4_NEPGR|nr:hypothetical protein Nepgr_030435 [Nepenthes gracilis]
MVNEFMACVDRIPTQACFEPVNAGAEGVVGHLRGTSTSNTLSLTIEGYCGCNDRNGVGEVCTERDSSSSGAGELRECRICQEEDEALEAPCACNGTLKFAHRNCVQRWCNKKGDITCEICYQVFSPNYSLPLPRSDPDMMVIDIRQASGSHISLQDHHLLALTAAEHQFLQSEYDYGVANSGNVACLGLVALILMVILLVRQVLMLTRDFGLVQESSTFFDVSFLQLAGFLLPCYVLARSWYTIQSRWRRQG